jgi:glycine dehydrogenase subunit 1
LPFIPHTPDDIAHMLEVIGAKSIDDLFDEIPPALKTGALGAVPSALSEIEVARLLTERALRDGTTNNRYENEDSPSFM